MTKPMRKSESGLTGVVWVRGLLVRPRLVFSVAFGIVVALTMPDMLGLHPLTRIILGWNAGAWVYLVLALLLMFRSTHESMRSRAIAEDDGRALVLTLVVLAAIVCLGTIFAQLAVARALPESARNWPVALAAIIGTSAQTADVGLSSRTMRRVGLVHCVLAFFFNASLLALTINIVSGLI